VHIGLRKSSVSVKDHKTVNQTVPILIAYFHINLKQVNGNILIYFLDIRNGFNHMAIKLNIHMCNVLKKITY
jgi:hypothetical protein